MINVLRLETGVSLEPPEMAAMRMARVITPNMHKEMIKIVDSTDITSLLNIETPLFIDARKPSISTRLSMKNAAFRNSVPCFLIVSYSMN